VFLKNEDFCHLHCYFYLLEVHRVALHMNISIWSFFHHRTEMY
jgi:hypothetical protein